jgi:hypothetical protein
MYTMKRLSGVLSANPKFGEHLEPRLTGFAVVDAIETDGTVDQKQLRASAWLRRGEDGVGYEIHISGMFNVVLTPATQDIEGDGRPDLTGMYCSKDVVWWVDAWLHNTDHPSGPLIYFKMVSPLEI